MIEELKPFTIEMYQAACPTSKNGKAWVDLLNKWASAYGVTTHKQAALFLAQTSHESQNYRKLEENLRYSASRLVAVFPRYFKTEAKAKPYAYNPEKLANYVYMDVNRSANAKLGNVKSGDGYRFRGRGLIQLTGRDNYSAFGQSIGLTAEEAADQMQHAEMMVRSGFWFWQAKDLNRFAEAGDVAGSTEVVNGGLHGIEDRQSRYRRIIKHTL